MHNIHGKKIKPKNYANAGFVGDFFRTAVNAVLMPGVTVGSRSLVGVNVVLEKDLDRNKSIFVKQELVEKNWNEERYG